MRKIKTSVYEVNLTPLHIQGVRFKGFYALAL